MSANNIKIGTSSADRAGAINPVLSDLSDISSTAPSAGQVLSYDGSDFEPVSLVDSNSLRGNSGNNTSESNVTLAIPNPYTAGYKTYFWEYAAPQIGTNTRFIIGSNSDVASLNNAYGSTLWACGLTLVTAGVYFITAHLAIGGLSASGSYIDVQWTDDSYNSLGPRCRIGKRDERRNTIIGVVEATANQNIGLYMHSLSGAKYNQTDYANIFINVERIS